MNLLSCYDDRRFKRGCTRFQAGVARPGLGLLGFDGKGKEIEVAFTIVIDGPNFINMLHNLGKSKEEILNSFSFEDLRGAIQKELRKRGLYSHPFLHAEFIYSNKERIGDFVDNKDQQIEDKKLLIDKIGNSDGFTPKEIPLTEGKQKEKGVDIAVFAKMMDVMLNSLIVSDPQHIVLVASDKDYVPALQLLRRVGIHTIVIGPKQYVDRKDKTEKEYPKELIYESYLFIDLREILEKMEEPLGVDSK